MPLSLLVSSTVHHISTLLASLLSNHGNAKTALSHATHLTQTEQQQDTNFAAALTHSLNSKRPSMLVVSMKLSMFRTCPLPWVTLSLYLSSCRSIWHVSQQCLAG